MPQILSNKAKELDKMNKSRRLDEYNSSNLKSFLKDNPNESNSKEYGTENN